MWTIILAVIIILLIAGTAYLVAALGRFGWIRSVSGESRLKRILISSVMTGVAFAGCYYVFSLINAIFILIYTILFFLIFGIFARIIGFIRKDESGIYWQGWLALLATFLFFLVGYFQCNNIWQTDYYLETEKNLGDLKIAMFADSHLGTTFDGAGFEKELKNIEAQHPDILLICGDFVDDWSCKADLIKACRAMAGADFKYGVWIAYGNHDEGFFDSRDFSAEELKQILEENGIHLLQDECQLVDDRFYVAGRRDRGLGGRQNMDQLLEGADTGKYIIVLDHEPNDYEAEAASDADLVLSGHTHGGQLIPINITGKLSGVHDRVYGYERRKGTDFIVTSGISDWALQFKTGTRSEYVIINISQVDSVSSPE